MQAADNCDSYCKGLEEIGTPAFQRCTSLHAILIPSTAKVFEDLAFSGCSSLMSVVFCKEIEKFMSAELLRDW